MEQCLKNIEYGVKGSRALNDNRPEPGVRTDDGEGVAILD